MIKKMRNLALVLLGVAWGALQLLNWYYGNESPFGLLATVAMLLFSLLSCTISEPAPPRKPPLRTLPQGPAYPAGVVLFVSLTLALPLWRTNWEPDQPVWDGFLALILIAIVAGSFLGVRYLQANHVEFGEARIRKAEPGADEAVR